MCPLLKPDSVSSLKLRRRIHLIVAVPTGYYGVELLPLASNPAKAIARRKQGRLLRQVLRVPWCIRTAYILKQFKIPDIIELAKEQRTQMISRYKDHPAGDRNCSLNHSHLECGLPKRQHNNCIDQCKKRDRPLCEDKWPQPTMVEKT